MPEVRTLLISHLRAPGSDGLLSSIAETLADSSIEELRKAARDEPASGDSAARMIAKLILDGEGADTIVDAAKAAAQRAPQDDAGSSVAKLAGEVVWRLSEQPRLAEPYFRRARRSDAADPDVLAFYRALFSSDTDASQLMQVLVQARRSSTDPEARYALAEEMSTLARERLHSVDRAIEVWRSVLREDASERRAFAQLERLYREAGKWTALVELLKEDFDLIPATEANRGVRIAKLLLIADLYRKELKLDAMALATLQRVLDIDPNHQGSLEALAETFAGVGRWNDLLAVYGNLLALARTEGDLERRVTLLREVAGIWVEKLGNPLRALEPLAEILELRPKDPDTRATMARIHEQRRDWRALVALRREDLLDHGGEEALALRIDLARLAEEKLGDRSEAIADWNQVLEHHGDQTIALEALSRLYEREGRWIEAAEILHRRVAGAGDPERAIPLLAELGSLYGERLRNSEQAIAVWSEVVRLVPGHDRALRLLRDAYVAASRWAELESLYLAQGRGHLLVDVLQGAADRVADIDARVDLYRRVATLCREHLGQPERALKALERTLAIQPGNLAVARELLPIYREQGNWARTLGTLEVLLHACTSDDERLAVIADLRRVAADHLQSPTLTYQWSARAYRLAPADASLLAQLEEAAEQSDSWDDLTQIFEARIAEVGEGSEQLLLLRKLAMIARDRLFKPDDAQRYFRRIIELDPTDSEAMGALEAIYTSTRRWEDLGEVYRRRMSVTDDRAARLDTLRGLARLQEDHLRDLEGAARTFRAILELSPDDRGVLDSLAAILRNRGEWAELAEVLDRKLGLADSIDLPTLFELSQVRASRLRAVDPAIDGYLRILELEPGHAETVRALEELCGAEPASAARIMRGLLPYYRRTNNHVREAEAMEVLLAEPPGDGEGESRRARLTALAGIYERMADRRADALRIFGELFEDDPSSWDERQRLQKLGRELGKVEQVALAYTHVLDSLARKAQVAEHEGRVVERRDTTIRRDLLLESAAIFRDDLGRGGDAERAYREVLERDETHQGAYEGLEGLLRGRAAHAELFKLYRRRVDVIFNQREQRELLGRMMTIARDQLADREIAVATAEELLDLVPDDVATIGLLARMYDEGNTHADREKLEELLGRWAELVEDPPRRFGLILRRAALRVQFLGDAFGAVDLLGGVLGEAPDHEDARALLEELLDISEVQLQVAALLEPIYQRVGDHAGRIRVLHVRRAQATAVGSVDEATSHLLEIARIEEHERRDLPTAFEAAREAYLIDPRRLDTRQEAERLGLRLGRESDLVELWDRALESEWATDRTLRVDLVRRSAELLDERVKDSVRARAAYVRLLDLDPPDSSLAHRAVAALVRLNLEVGDFAALIAAQRALLRYADAPAEQVRIRLEIAANQLDQLMDRVGAALTWGEVVDIEPTNSVALDALERLFVEEEEWQRLCEVLEHRIAVAGDPRAQSALWRRIGDLRRGRLGHRQGAIDAFQSVLELKAGREDSLYAQRQLVELNRELERWADLEEGLRRLVAMADRDADRVQLLTDTAEVVGAKLGRVGDALDLLKRVLDLAPTDSRARAMVRGYLEHEDLRDRAIRILSPLFEAERNWASLLELQELQARNQPSGRRRLQALLQVAATQEEKLQDSQRAFQVLCEALEAAGDQPELAEILEKVLRLGEAADRADALLAALQRTVDRILDSELQQRALGKIGFIALDRLGRLDDARVAYRRLLELAPGNATAMSALEQIYLRQGSHHELADLLVSRAELEGNSTRRDELLIRAAGIARTQLDQAERAIELYERLSGEALARADVQAVLEPLYEAAGRHRELAAHLNRKLTTLGGKLLVDTHLRLGRLYGEQLADPEAGIRHLSSALRLDPTHAVGTDELARYLDDEVMRARAIEILEPVFLAVQDWPRLLHLQELKLAAMQDPEERMRSMLRMAQLREEQLEDLEGAFESYARLFAEQPGNLAVRSQLARLAGILDCRARYGDLLARHVDEREGEESEEVLGITRDAAELYAGLLRQPARAVPLFRRLHRAQPDDLDVFLALEDALTRSSGWAELVEVYWAEADASLDAGRQVEILSKLASVAQDALAQPDEAARALQRVIELRPDHELARARLEQVLQASERYRDLLELLRDRLVRTSGMHERVGVQLQIAELQAGVLDDAEGAIDTLDALLAEAAGEAHAVAMLEQLAERHVAQRPRIFDILEPVYEAAANTQRRVAVCEWRLSVTENHRARHELYARLAALLLKVDNGPQFAFRALTRALAEPGPEEALAALDREIESVARLLDLPDALADALVAAAAAPALKDELDRRLELLIRAGRIRLASAPDRAAEVLRSAVGLRDDHEDALALLDEALVRLGFHEELEAVLGRRIAVVADDRVRVELLRRLGSLHEDVLARPQEAEACWQRLLELEPSDAEALGRLSRRYEASGSTQELREVLERQIDAAADSGSRRELRMRLANLLREALKDREAEIDVLRSLLTEVPTDDDAMGALARALLADSRHAEAADVLQDRATLAQAAERKAALMLEAARLYAGPLADPVGAIERYEQVLDLVDGHAGALADLVELCQRAEVSEAAAALARPRLSALGQHAELARVLEARAQFASDPDEVVANLRALAELQRGELGDVGGALQTTLRLVERLRGRELETALSEAIRLAGEIDRWRLSTTTDELAARAMNRDLDPEQRQVITKVVADAASKREENPAKALAVLVAALDGEIADAGICARIEDLAAQAGERALLVRALEAASQLAADGEARKEIFVRLGGARVGVGDLEGACDAYREALAVAPDEALAVAGLERLLVLAIDADPSGAPGADFDRIRAAVVDLLEAAYQRGHNNEGLADLVRVRLRDASGGDRNELLRALALLLEEGGGTPEEALAAWGELLAEDAESVDALDQMQKLAHRHGLLPQAGGLMIEAVRAARSASRGCAGLVLATARLWLDELGDPARASECVQPSLAESHDNPELLQLAVRIARARGEGHALHAALVASAKVHEDPVEAAKLWAEAAAVAEGSLADPRAAVDDLLRLLEVDEQRVEAWTKLFALLAASGRDAELADGLVRRIAVTGDAGERRDLRYRLANHLSGKLARPDDAIAVYNDMIAEDAQDLAAIRELEVQLRRLERWRDLRDLLSTKLDATPEAERLAVQEEIVRVAEERLEDRVDAIEQLERILVEHPDHAASLHSLERLLVAEERWPDLADLLKARMDGCRAKGDTEGYRTTASELASLLAERLDDGARAQEILTELLDVDPAYVPAILSLASVYESRGDEGAMRLTLKRAAELDPRGKVGASLMVRLARLADDEAERVRLLEHALELAPGHEAASRVLLELSREKGRWDKVAHLLELRLSRVEDATTRRALQLERCDVLIDRLGDLDGALRTLAGIYQVEQDDYEVNRRIADALFRAQRFEEARGMYEWLADASAASGRRKKEKAIFLTRLARIQLSAGEAEAAQKRLEESYRIDTTNVETLIALGATHEHAERWPEALKIYRAMLLQNAEKSGALRRGDIYLRLSVVHLHLDEQPKALAMVRRGLEEDPGHAGLTEALDQIEGSETR